jgi:hypothetical protein
VEAGITLGEISEYSLVRLEKETAEPFERTLDRFVDLLFHSPG